MFAKVLASSWVTASLRIFRLYVSFGAVSNIFKAVAYAMSAGSRQGNVISESTLKFRLVFDKDFALTPIWMLNESI